MSQSWLQGFTFLIEDISSFKNTSGSLGEREMWCKHEPTGECIHSVFELKHGEHIFLLLLENTATKNKENNLRVL